MTLNTQQQKALDLVKNGENVFITGSAGVGKSFLISEIIKYIEQQSVYYQVLAYTGVAAINVNGSTIHRMFGLKPETRTLDDYIRFCNI
jgi:F0F1-type ATP synthase beta subunit